MTITLLWHHPSKHGSKSQATLRAGLQVQLHSLTDHPRASSKNLMISTSIMATEVTNWQIAGSFAILWRISNWYEYNTTEMMLWQKATYFQNTAIWGHLYVVKILRNGAIIYFSWIVKCFSLWQSGFSESERMSGSVWCPKRWVRNVWFGSKGRVAFKTSTRPKTYIGPKKRWLGSCTQFWEGPFAGDMLVLGRVLSKRVLSLAS